MLRVVLLVAVLGLHVSPVWATVLFSRIADDTGTVNQAASISVWDATGGQDYPNNILYYRNATPVPGTGHTLYFQNDFQTAQHDAGNFIENFGTINLSTGATYYLGGFFRFDRIGGVDVWEDVAQPDSYDKLLEFQGNFRWLIMAGWPNSNYLGSYDGKFTFDVYVSPNGCTGCDNPSEKWANVSPYGQNNPYLCDYGRWYAVVLKLTLSSGGSATDGLAELFINGTKTTSLTLKTQDSTSPNITRFGTSGTVAQPSNNAPAHYRKMDHVLFANSLADMTNAGLMSDPEAGGGSVGGGYPIGSKRLAPGLNLRRGN